MIKFSSISMAASISLTAALGVAIILSACGPNEPIKNSESTKGNPATTELITKIKGCEVQKVTYEYNTEYHLTKEFVIAICDQGTASVREPYQCGKSTCYRDNLTVPNVKEKTEEEILAEKKTAALSKISDEDKALLGLK